MQNQNKNLALFLEGGIGDTIGQTVVVRNLVKQGWTPHILTGYPAIFEHHPNIGSLTQFGSNNWYVDIAQNCDQTIRANFYNHSLVRQIPCHFTEFICRIHNAPFDNEYPDYCMTKEEERWAWEFKRQHSNSKKMLLLHPFAGVTFYKKKNTFEVSSNNKYWKENYVRDFVKMTKHEFFICHVGFSVEPKFLGTIKLSDLTIRQIIALVKVCDVHVSVDSFLNHASAIFKKPGVVLWGKNKPETFGYSFNTNLLMHNNQCPTPFCGRPDGSLGDQYYDENGKIRNWFCPNYICQDIPAEQVYAAVKQLVI